MHGDKFSKKGVTGLYSWKKRFDDQKYYNKKFYQKENVVVDPWIGFSNDLSCIEGSKIIWSWMRDGKVGPYPHGINKKNEGTS